MPATTGLTAAAGVLFIILVADLIRHIGKKTLSSPEWSSAMSPEPGTTSDPMSVTDESTHHSEPVSITSGSQSSLLVRKWIITHTDFDGLTSGALLLRLAGKDAAIRFSSPAALLKNLQQTSSGLIHGDTIYIADLALQPHREHEFAALLSDIKDRGIRVVWFDHHEWPAGLLSRMRTLCSELVVDTGEKTAAVLIRRNLPADDEHADRLIRFVQNRSLESDKKWTHTWRMALTEISQRRDPEMSDTLLRSWSANEQDTTLLNYLARQGEKREKATARISAHLHRREKTTRNRSLLVIDVRPRRLEKDEKGRTLFVFHGFQPSMMVGIQACRLQHADFCIIIWDDFRYSVYRGLDTSIEFGSLFGQHEWNGTAYRVGGHQYAVSVRALPAFWPQLQALFRFRLGPEAETVIRTLCENF